MNKILLTIALLIPSLSFTACTQTKATKRVMEITAYDPGPKSCGWKRSSPDFWNRRVAYGPREGEIYTGRTASGVFPKQVRPPMFSKLSLEKPINLFFRIFWPPAWIPRDGSIAADTKYYPFGTRIYVPGYGWGVVEDRGGAIKGPNRLDLFYRSYDHAIEWGRQNVEVIIQKN